MLNSFRKMLITLSVGFTGALSAQAFGLPAPALLGATITVSCASLLRITRDIPAFLKNIAFAVIGCSLGSSITTETLADMSKWPASLAILGITVIAIVYFGGRLLETFFHESRATGFLATSPGALAYVLALAADGQGDLKSIAVIQTIRLVAIITTIPLLLAHFGMHPEQHAAAGTVPMAPVAFTAIFAGALVIGLLFARMKIPAAFFLAGIGISGIAHLLGYVSGPPADEIIFVGFTITGSLVGARFSTIPLKDLRNLFWGSISALLLSLVIASIFAAAVAKLLSLPFGQVFVAFAPGGVEAMAAMALSLNYDPAYVAVHHLFRIFFLIL
ncbi:MAG: AbrB family transcriptional regulator, partial [Desulfocapsaceae bacterium]|nr:AbrB family transcriptional regulator [Desulfocapsaceae bacterium]